MGGFDEERERYVRAGIASISEVGIRYAKAHPWDGAEDPGAYWARAFAELEGAFVPDLDGTPESIAEAFRALLREKGLPEPANLDAAIRNARVREERTKGDPKGRRSRLAICALSLTGASNRALREAGDARRWCTLLREGQYVLYEAIFVLLEPKAKHALVEAKLFRTFAENLGRQLLSLPLAIAFWIAALHAWRSQTTLSVAIAGALFALWFGARRVLAPRRVPA